MKNTDTRRVRVTVGLVTVAATALVLTAAGGVFGARTPAAPPASAATAGPQWIVWPPGSPGRRPGCTTCPVTT